MWVKFSSVSLKALSAVFWEWAYQLYFPESCKDNLVVESNGDIYECDHFVYPQYKIGNINKSELKTMNSVQLTAQKNGFQRNVSNVYINLSAMVVALSIVLLK